MVPVISQGSNFGGLVRYLHDNRKAELLDVQIVTGIDTAVDAMELVAGLSERVKSPVWHMSFSASVEDGKLTADTWLSLVGEAERELGLTGHQRMVFRHCDRPYDHIHVVWCTVHPETGKTPPKRWFRKKGALLPQVGARALTASQHNQLHASQRGQNSWNSFALKRLQEFCRDFEASHRLRELRTPDEVAEARRKGEARPPRGDRKHRCVRTGDRPIERDGDGIRNALDEPSWEGRARRLAALGYGLRPFQRSNKPEIIGIQLFELANPDNAVAASTLDQPGKHYGLKALEKRTGQAAPSFSEWLTNEGSEEVVSVAPRVDWMQARYQAAREKHRIDEYNRKRDRDDLGARHKQEIIKLSQELLARRRSDASTLPPSERKPFYVEFAKEVRSPLKTEMSARHQVERAQLRRRAMSTFASFRKSYLTGLQRVSGSAADTRELSINYDALPSLHKVPGIWQKHGFVNSMSSAMSLLGGSGRFYSKGEFYSVKTLNDLAVVTGALPLERRPLKGPAGARSSRLLQATSRVAEVLARSLPLIEYGTISVRHGPPMPIDGFSPQQVENEVRYCRTGQPIAFVDHDLRVAAHCDDDEGLRAALKLALSKSDDVVVVRADDATTDRIFRLAIALGQAARVGRPGHLHNANSVTTPPQHTPKRLGSGTRKDDIGQSRGPVRQAEQLGVEAVAGALAVPTSAKGRADAVSNARPKRGIGE